MLRSRLVVVGCGPHFQEKYFNILEKNRITISLLIDLEASKEDVLRFFSRNQLQPKCMLFLNERYRMHIEVKDIDALISRLCPYERFDGILLSTEPKGRMPYIIWACELGIPVFMDKPITAFTSSENSSFLLKDFDAINQALKKTNTDAVVSCERRAHPGYLWLFDYLKNFIREKKVPITSIDIHYAGGIFNLPHEYASIENHPFKYGYGILLHSGYHYVDLLARLLALNKCFLDLSHTSFLTHVLYSDPIDQMQWEHNYSLLLSEKELKNIRKCTAASRRWGETDLLLIGQEKHKGKVVTNFSVKLFGTSLSLRKEKDRSSYLPGRARQEYVTLHLGHQCSIHISSLPLKKLDPVRYTLENFDMTILHAAPTGKHTLIHIDREQLSVLFPYLPKEASMNGFARQWQLEEFLHGRNGNSAYESHRDTVQLLDLIYSSRNGKDANFSCKQVN